MENSIKVENLWKIPTIYILHLSKPEPWLFHVPPIYQLSDKNAFKATEAAR